MTEAFTQSEVREIARSAQALAFARTEVKQFLEAMTEVSNNQVAFCRLHDSLDIAQDAWHATESAIYRASCRNDLNITRYVEEVLVDTHKALAKAQGHYAKYQQMSEEGNGEEAFEARAQLAQAIRDAVSVIGNWAEYAYDFELMKYGPRD
jgi:plasmid maintenance system antidote protein VapI